MTAFTDYLDLRTAVLETVRDTSVADVMDRLTKLAEARFNRELRCREQITETNITVTSGVGALPDDFLELIGAYDGYGREFVQQPLQAVQPTHYSYVSVSGSNLVGNDRTYRVQYYAAIPTLTTALTTSNWLLQKYPEVYLYGVSCEAAKWLRDAEAAPVLESYRDRAILDAQADDTRQRYSRARVRLGTAP